MDGALVTPASFTHTRPDSGLLLDAGHSAGRYAGIVVQRAAGVPLVARCQPTAVAQKAPHRPQRLTAGIDFSDPQLPVNFVAPDFPPLKTLVPGPRFSPALKGDAWLDWAGSKPGDIEPPPYVGEQDSLSWVLAQLQERQHTEAENGEFQFQPLLTCLENMQVFIRHIQDGLQFPEPLTEEEAAALARILAQTAPLVTGKTPYYKRTVCLSLSLMILCDIITDRQILDAARAQEDKTARHRRIGIRSLPEGRTDRARLLAALPLLPLPPGAPGRHEDLPLPWYSLTLRTITKTINDQTLLLYPSFHPLTIGHFCRLGHLPLHPVGLTTDYACDADGSMMSPLGFAEHDLGHMTDRCNVGYATHWAKDPKAALLKCHDKRLQLGQLLLDSLPDAPGWQPLEAPLTLLLFQLLHELVPVFVVQRINDSGSAFLFFLKLLAQARRDEWNSYTEDDRHGTDKETTEAALWAASLWKLWIDTGSQIDAVTPAMVHELAGRFAREARPELQAHLAFLERHRGTVRQLFIDNSLIGCSSPGGNCFETSAAWPQQHSLTLFRYALPQTGLCHLDNTDLAYFAALHSPALCQQIEARTGDRLPGGAPGTGHHEPPAS